MVKAISWQWFMSLAVARSVPLWCHKCCQDTLETRDSCCRLSLFTKPTSTIVNLTPSGNCWYDIPRTKKFNSVLSVGKTMVTVCWDNKECYCWQLLAKRTTMNSNCYAETQGNLNARLHRAHTQKTCLKCHSSMTTLSCTQVCTPQRPSSEILNGQCCHIHPIILNLPNRLLPALSSKSKPARTPLHQWWGTA
jgi:hypothetical protein